MVGLGGLEPPTSPLSGARSSHLSYRPAPNQCQNLITKIRPAANARYRKSCFIFGWSLLNKTHCGWRSAWLGSFFDGAKLRLISRNIFPEGTPDPLRVAWTHNHTAQQFALGPIRKNVDKIQRELFDVVMNHHQITVEPLQFFFFRFDLHLSRLWLLLLFVHAGLPEVRFPKYHSRSTSLVLFESRFATRRKSLLTAAVIKASLELAFTIVNYSWLDRPDHS